MDQDSPLVSVVVSAYNRPEMLQVALLSVLRQSYTKVEVIVQDDSTDARCEEVVRRIADNRVVYSHNRPSLGTVRNLRAGYRSCRGKYFSTLNDDDLYAPEYLTTMVAALEKDYSCSIAFSDHFIINENGEVMHAETESNSIRWGRSVLKEGIIVDSLHTTLVAKSVPGMFAVFRAASVDLGDFPDEVSSAYDYWMTYLAVRNGSPIYYCPERLTSYRVHSGSQTSSFGEPMERVRFCTYSEFIDRRFLADQRLEKIWPDVRQHLVGVHNSAGFTRLRTLQRSAARREFRSSLHIRKTVRAFAGIALSFAPATVLRKL
jgi:glycosyltransferase involved in cell wall biosynthesis